MAKKGSLEELETIIQYRFKKRKILSLALTHSSYKNELRMQFPDRKIFEDNERFEFLGDTILSYTISKTLFSLFENYQEGELSKFRSVLVSREQLFTIAKKMKLRRFLNLGKSESKGTINEKIKILANAVEALIAAIYLDRGLKKAEAFILLFWGPYLEEKKLSRLDKNYKSTLQEFSQKELKLLPIYNAIAKKGVFHATVSLGRGKKAVGKGKNKREAEQLAARNLIRKLKI